MSQLDCDLTILLPARAIASLFSSGGELGRSNAQLLIGHIVSHHRALVFTWLENIARRFNTPSQTAWRVPGWIKVVYTAFMALLVPIYWSVYGPAVFLYFCTVALLLTLIAIWLENALLSSMCAVGIVVLQTIWTIDLVSVAVGFPLTGMTNYMFEANQSLFLRLLSLFHCWLPPLLIYLVWRTGYDKRAFWGWTLLAWGLLLICFFAISPPSTNPGLTLVNINFIRGFSNTAAQVWVSPYVWLVGLLIGLPLLVFAPAHFLLVRFMPKAHRCVYQRARQELSDLCQHACARQPTPPKSNRFSTIASHRLNKYRYKVLEGELRERIRTI